MSLPSISIPFELPIPIEVLLHPPVVHFVIALPVVIILLEIINLGFKQRSLSLFSLFLILLLGVATTAAYFTGSVDGKEAFMFLSDDGKAELKEHKLLGAYLVYGSWALVVLKLLFMAISRVVAKLFFVLILLGFMALIMIQGKDGGKITYQYGANNQALSEMSDEKDELQEEYDELEEELNELKEDASKASTADTSSSEELKALQAKYDELQTKYDELAKSAESKAEEKATKATEEAQKSVTPAADTVNLAIPSDANRSH